MSAPRTTLIGVAAIMSAVWWKAAGERALRTALVVVLPYLGAVKFADIPWLAVLSAAGLAAILSLATSAAGISEVNGQQPWYVQMLSRFVKTAAQTLAAGLITATYIQDVHWPVVLQAALIAGLGTVVMAFIAGLPGTPADGPQFGLRAHYGKAA